MPAKAVTELNRLLQEKGDVEIKFGENQASFALKDDKGFSVLAVADARNGARRAPGHPLACHVALHGASVLQLIRQVRLSRARSAVARAAARRAVPADPDLPAHPQRA